MPKYSIQDWVRLLDLKPHPEGGYFSESYRSTGEIPQSALPEGFSGSRSFSSAIYYLLPGDSFSAFHRIRSDEIWHFYAGTDLMLFFLTDGSEALQQVRLGPDPATGAVFQFAVPAGCWFAARVIERESYALVGCTVAPGFDYQDFELAQPEELLNSFPKQAELIQSLTRK